MLTVENALYQLIGITAISTPQCSAHRTINEETGLALATISRLADRGRDYYHDLVEDPAEPVQ